jgi:serine/threonine protein kinase
MASDADRPERKQPFKPSEPTEQFRLRSPGSETVDSPASVNLSTESQSQLTFLEKIGEGAMGAVYKAQLPDSDDLVAVKVLHANLVSDKVSLRRFEKEAIAIGQLTHPNIVQVYEFVADSEKPHLIMEYVDGCSLADVLRNERTVPVQRVIDWVIQISSAIQHAHEKGIVHRDLKPSNILISESRAGDSIKLVDFGIAKLAPRAGSVTELTQTGEVFGSPNYMSPEQCMGKPVDGRSDIYSLGCIIYEALSGKNLFSGENSIQYLVQHISSPVTGQLKSLRGFGVPIPLIAVIEKMLQKDPNKRYQTALEVENEFRRLAAGKASAASQKKLLIKAGIASGAIAAIAAVVALAHIIPGSSLGAGNDEQISASSAAPHFAFNLLDGGAESKLQQLVQASKDNWTYITSQAGRDRATRDHHDSEYRQLQNRLHSEIADMGVKAIPALLSFLKQQEVNHECVQDLEALGTAAVEPCVEWLKTHPRDYQTIAPVFWKTGKPACDRLAELAAGGPAERAVAASVLATRFSHDNQGAMMSFRVGLRGNEKFLSTISQKYLIDGLRKETKFEVKRDLLLSLRNIDDPSSTTCDAVMTLLKSDPNEDVKVAATGTVAYWANRVTGPVWVKLCKQLTDVLLSDDSADVRVAAAEGLGALERTTPAVIEALRKAKQSDSSGAVHQATLVALTKLAANNDDLLPDLKEALTDSDANTQYAALNAVSSLGPKAAFLVPEILQSKARTENKLGSLASTQSEDKEVQAVMMQALDSADDIQNWNRARVAIEYFSRLGPKAKAAIPALQKVADGKCAFNFEAKAAIKKINVDVN